MSFVAVLAAEWICRSILVGFVTIRFNCTSYAVQAIRKAPNIDFTWLIAPSREMGLIYEPLNQNFFATMLFPLLDTGEVRVGAVTTRQVLFVEGRVLADQVAVCLVDVGERPQLAGLPPFLPRRGAEG